LSFLPCWASVFARRPIVTVVIRYRLTTHAAQISGSSSYSVPVLG
jgi:hypothetical protein